MKCLHLQGWRCVEFDYYNGTELTTESSNVVTGTNSPEYRLDVTGVIRGCKVYAEASDYCWPDYVFDDNYNLMSISDLKQFIKLNRHLPGIPDAETVNSKKVDLLKMNRDLLEKVKELTLYVIDLQKQIDELKTNNMRIHVL